MSCVPTLCTEMMKLIGLIAMLLAVSAIGLTHSKTICGGKLIKPSGHLDPANNATADCSCKWTFNVPKVNATLKRIYFYVMSTDLDVDDTVSIEDGIGNDTQHDVLITGNDDQFSYVTNTLNVTIFLNCSSVKKTRHLKIDYSSENCVRTVDEPSGVLMPPTKVADNVNKLNCSYVIRSTDSVQYLSFSDFNMGSSSVSIHDGSSAKSLPVIATYSGSSEVADIITTSHFATLTMKLDYSSHNIPQFNAYYAAISDGCSRMFTFDAAHTTFQLKSPNYPKNYPSEESDCRWIIKSKDNTKLHVTFTDFDVADASDYVELRDGPRKDSKLIAMFTNDTFSKSRYIFTSQDTLWARFYADSGPSARGFSADVAPEINGGYFKDKGIIKMDKKTAATGLVYSYMLKVSPNEQVQLNLIQNSTELYSNSELWIYNGYDVATAQLLDVFESDRTFYDIVSTGNEMMILAKKFGGPNSFKASFKGIPYGHHNISSGDVGTKTVDSAYLGSLSWVIRPLMYQKKSMLIALTISALQLDGKDQVKIYPLNDLTNPLLTFDSDNLELATMYIEADKGISVEIQRSFKHTSPTTVFTGSYRAIPECIEVYDLSKTKSVVIQSANFPNQYPLNAKCNWMLKIPKNTSVLISGTHLDTLPNHKLTLLFANGTAYGNISGSVLPDDIIMTDVQQLNVTFNSIVNNGSALSASGFRFVVTAIDCGGNAETKTGIIKTTGYPAKVKTPTVCAWKISVPWNIKNGSHQYITFTTNLTPNITKDLTFSVYEGGSMRNALVKNVTSKKGGQSIRNIILVVYNKTGTKESPGLSITYQASACSKSMQCGDGTCIHDTWRCNGIAECPDARDELNCGGHVPPSGGKSSNVSKGVASYVVVICVLLFFVIGILLGIFAPRLYNRYKTGEMYSSFSNIPNPT